MPNNGSLPDKVNKMVIKKKEAIELWAKTFGHISQICKAIGISRTTFYDWMNNDVDFQLELINAEGELNDEIRNVLIEKAAAGDMTAVIFYLKNRHPDFKQGDSGGNKIQNNYFTLIQNEKKQFG